MEKKSGMIQELIHELKRQAGPWKQELKDCVAEISTCLDSLFEDSNSIRKVDTEAACQVLRRSFRPLYESFPLLSLQLSVRVFTMITADKIVNAEVRDGSLDRLYWDDLAAQLLSGVLDYLDDHDSETPKTDSNKVKTSVGQAFYANLCLTFFPSEPTATTTAIHSGKLRDLAYRLLSQTASSHPENQQKLRKSSVLGGRRLGQLILNTKDYLPLEGLLLLLAPLIPPLKVSSPRVREKFIKEAFQGTQSNAGHAICRLLIGTTNIREWEEMHSKVIDILASDITFPQPFSVAEIVIGNSPFRSPDRLIFDRQHAIYTVDDNGACETIRVLFKTIKQVKIESSSGSIQILMSSPAMFGDMPMAPAQGHDPSSMTFRLRKSDVDRFVTTVTKRGMGPITFKDGTAVVRSKHRFSLVRTTLGEDPSDDLPPPPSYDEKVKNLQADDSSDNESKGDSRRSGNLSIHAPSACKPITSYPVPVPIPIPVPTHRLPTPATPPRGPQAPRHPTQPALTVQVQLQAPPTLTRGRPPTITSSGKLPRTQSKMMRDGVFGASDEELSELSEHEIVAVPKKLFDTAPGAGASKTDPARVAKNNGGACRGRTEGGPQRPGGGESEAEEEVTDPSSGSESDRAPPIRGRGRKVVGSFASNPTATQEKKATSPSKHNKAPVKKRAVAEESEIDEGHSGSESDRTPPVKGKGGRGRRVVSSFVSEGRVEAAPDKAVAAVSSKGKPPKKKATAKEFDYDDGGDDEHPPSPPPQPTATTKTQTRPTDRKSAPQPKPKAARQKRKEVVEEPMEEGEGEESPAPRRSTRASAAAASKKIAKVAAAGYSSQESSTGEGAKETTSPLPPAPVLPTKVVAKPGAAITKSKGKARADDSETLVPTSEDRPRAAKAPTVIPSPPKPMDDATRTSGTKRKRGAQEDRDDNPFLVDETTVPSPKRVRASEAPSKSTKSAPARSDSQVTKSHNNATTRTTKKYGAKKDRIFPPVRPSTRADAIEVDFDEIPGSRPARVTAPSTSTFAFDTLPPSSPQRSSSPATVLPMTKPLVSSMKGKDGKVTPQKATALTKPRARAIITKKKEQPPPPPAAPLPDESDSEPPGVPVKTRATKPTRRAPAGGKKSGKRGARPLSENLSSDSEPPKATKVARSPKTKHGAKKTAAAVMKNSRHSGNQNEDEDWSVVEDEIRPFSSPPRETRAAAKTRAAGKASTSPNSATTGNETTKAKSTAKSNKAPWLDEKFSPKSKELPGEAAKPRQEHLVSTDEVMAGSSDSELVADNWETMEVVEDAAEVILDPPKAKETTTRSLPGRKMNTVVTGTDVPMADARQDIEGQPITAPPHPRSKNKAGTSEDVIMAPPAQPERGTRPHTETEEMEVLLEQPFRERAAYATQAPAQPLSPSPPPAPLVDNAEGDPDATLLPDIDEFTVRSKAYDVIIESPQSYGEQAHAPLEVRNVSISSPPQREVTSVKKHRKSVSFLEREEDDMDVTVVGELQDETEEGEAEPIVSTTERDRSVEVEEIMRQPMSSKARGKQRAVETGIEERPSPLMFAPKAGYLNLHGSVQPSRPRTADPPRQTLASASPRINAQVPPRFEQPVRQGSIGSRPRPREERPATDDPLEAIFETINKITDAIKYGIQCKYDGVRDSTRQLKTKLLMRATEDLDELHEDNVTTYNTLLALEQAYTDYSQRSLDALTEAHRVGAESQKKLKELIKEHDRMAKEHARKVPSMKSLPGSIAKWKTK